MKTIKDAVIELGGRLQEKTTHILTTGAFWLGDKSRIGSIAESIFEDGKHYISETKTAHFAVNQSSWVAVCTRQEFEAEAKRMGYINGYEWGKEYQTNGKRPDLPDDVEIEGLTPYLWNKCTVNVMWWNMVKSFRITDPRFKPADDEQSGMPSVDGGKGWDGFDPRKNNWHERGVLPVAGTKVELWIGGQYKEDVEFLCRRKFDLVFWRFTNDSVDSASTPTAEVRPIKSHRETVIEAALDVAIENDGLYGPLVPHINQILERLFKSNMLVLPQNSGDTED